MLDQRAVRVGRRGNKDGVNGPVAEKSSDGARRLGACLARHLGACGGVDVVDAHEFDAGMRREIPRMHPPDAARAE